MRFVAVIVCLWGLGAVSLGADWPGYRGPAGTGVGLAGPALDSLPAAPEPSWTVRLGESYSGFSYVAGRLYTCGSSTDGQTAYCIDAETGRIVWRTVFSRPYRNNWGNGPRATPSVDKGGVYVVGAEGRVFCLAPDDGRVLWTRSLGPPIDYGYSGSVLIEGNLAIVCAGSDEGALMAFDKKTGETVWGAGRDRAGYATPFPFDLDGRRYVVGFMAKSVIIADIEQGEEVWRLTWRTQWDANASAPIFHDGILFLTSAYGTGSAAYALRRDGERLRHREVWRRGTIQNQFTGFVLYEGHLYGASESRGGQLVCVDFRTGAVKWSARRDKFASVMVAGGNLIVQGQKGEIEMAPASSDAYEPRWSATVVPPTENRFSKLNNTWQAPLLIDGKLFARNMEHMVCVEIE